MSENVTIPYEQYLQGMICDPSDYVQGGADTTHCLTRGQSIGLTIVAESGFVSLFAILYVFWIILRNAFHHARGTAVRNWRFVQDPSDVFMLSLFFADFLQALGAVLDIKWINDGQAQVGSFCTAQGVIQQLGETGVAITTLTIAIHTFALLRWNLAATAKPANGILLSMFIVTLIWTFIIIMVVVGNALNKSYEQPTPYWCWIGNHHMGYRIAGEYIWFWITLVVSLILYATLFFWSRGNINFSKTSWWKMSAMRRRKNTADDLKMRAKPWVMLAYPLVYSILILPLSVVRWITFNDADAISSEATSAVTLVVISIYGLSGFFNVILLLRTRPDSMLFGHGETSGRAPSILGGSTTDVEMNGRPVRRPRLPSIQSDISSLRSTYSE